MSDEKQHFVKTLFERNKRDLLNYFARRVGRDDAADLLQETFVSVLRYDNHHNVADPPAFLQMIAINLTGQLKPLPPGKPEAPEAKDPAERVANANEAAHVQAARNGYINAVQIYPFSDGALYQVYTAPGQVTDIALRESEQLVGSGPVAAGDTVRWIIGDTESGTDASRKVHILAKPTRCQRRNKSMTSMRPDKVRRLNPAALPGGAST